MAQFYMATSPGQTAKLNDGMIVGGEVRPASDFNTKRLAKGSGSLTVKEVKQSGSTLDETLYYTFLYNDLIVLPNV